jgi:quaternary ammonium compound-resistance protein SugE
MAWVYLLIAGLLEIVWAMGMKQSQGFTRLVPGAVTLAAMLASVGFLAAAMRELPLGTAYAMWTGIGTLGAFGLGILVLGEPANPMRIAAAGLILSGLVLMKAAT